MTLRRHWLLYLGHLGSGGVERQFQALARGLAGAGHKVTMACDRAGGDHWQSLAGVEGVRRQEVGGVAGLRQLLRASPPDLVYSALYMPNLRALAATRGTGIPVVWGVRGTALQPSWQTSWPTRLAQLAARICSSRVPLMIANSNAAQRAHQQAGYAPQHFVVVDNGVDAAWLRPDPNAGAAVRQRLGIPEDALVLGCVARLDPLKNHAGLLQAYQQVLQTHANCWLLLVGAGQAAVERQLQADIQRLQLSQVQLLGHCPEVLGLYQTMDAHVLASSSESFPNALVEAMACGVPCVATDVGDVRRILGATGVVVAAGAPEALAAAVLELLDKLLCGVDAGSPGRLRVLQEFSLEKMVQRTEDAVAVLLDGPTLPHPGCSGTAE